MNRRGSIHIPASGCLRAVLVAVAFSLGAVAFQPGTVSAEVDAYRVYVTRIAKDVYREQASRLLIVTRYCYEYTYGDSAILLYERGSLENRLIFSGSSECNVRGVYRPNAELTRLAENVYRDAQTGGIVRTQLCLSLALGESALVLEDRVIFIDSRDECELGY